MSNLVLYRKYRPQKFQEVIDQEHIKTTLSNAVAHNRVGHAYLFTGPRGVGKTTLARIFARAVNCQNRQGSEPCNQCDVCTQFLAGSSLDLLEIDAASHTGVDNIRELIEHLQFAPSKAQYKVIIVDEVHMLSKGAFNALLKTLEEPPRHALFILATTEIHKVPATIISRSQRFDFKKVGIAEIKKLLKYVADDIKVKITDEALIEIATAADGSFRDALSLLDQVVNYASGDVTEELVEQVLGLTSTKTISDFFGLIVGNSTQKAVNFISDLMFGGRDLFQFEKDFLEYLRKVLLVKVGVPGDLGLSEESKAKLQEYSQKLSTQQLIKIIQIFQKAESDLKWATIQSLPLELAVIEATSEATEMAPIQPIKNDPPKKAEVAEINKKPEETEPATSTHNPDALQSVLDNWNQILEKIKDYNHSLISSLKLAVPTAVAGRELILLFPYKFHKDAIDARKNRIIVDQVLEEVLGIKLMVKPLLQKDWKGDGRIPLENPPEDLVDSALKIMGGEIEN
jgi:DNA polymerase III subunit gamma/tau